MKLLGKILSYITGIGISLVLILFIISILFEKDISRIFLKELNKRLNTTVSTGEMNFSLLRRFPQASIDIDDFLILSTFPDDEEGSYQQERDSLLYAGKITLSLKITELIRKNYIIDRIDISRGKINLLSDSQGKLNTAVWKKQPENDTSLITLNINSINIDKSSFTYSSLKTGFIIRTRINNSSNRLVIDNKSATVRSQSDLILSGLKTGPGYNIQGPYPLVITAGLMISADSIIIRQSQLETGDLKLETEGFIATGKSELSLRAESSRAPAGFIAEFLPGQISSFLNKYNITGLVSSSLELKGSYKKGSSMIMTASLDVSEAESRLSSPAIEIKNIRTTANMKLDLGNSKRLFEVSTSSYKARFDNTDISGSFYLENLSEPHIDISLRGLFPSTRLSELADVAGLHSRKGTVRLNARFTGTVPGKQEEAHNPLPELRRSVNIGLGDVNLSLPGLKGELENINGNIMIADNIWVDELSLSHDGQNIALNGMIDGFNSWMLDKKAKPEITAGIWADKLDINKLMHNLKSEEKAHNEKTGKTIPLMNLNIRCDSLIIGAYRASLFDGNLSYRSGLVDIPSFSMNALGGSISGNAAIAELGDKAYAVRGWFHIENIDIRNTFEVSNNFRQDYIKAENLEGDITGNISISATADSTFRINSDDLVLNGEYYILNGSLVDFEPVYKLSKFIDIKELERIDFSRLENDLIISEGSVKIPGMDISSSAFNISLEGSHSFDGNYQYRLKVLLSELLSKKKNNKVSEFGVIEEDGLGRTSLYLKIDGDAGGSKVSHDSDALRAGIKESLVKEKQEIKSILNQEFGWYKGDSIHQVSTDKSRRFRIIWEETDSIKTETEKSSEKKLPLINIFKKKNIKEGKTEK